MTVARVRGALGNWNSDAACGKVVCIPKPDRAVGTTRDKIRTVGTRGELNGIDLLVAAVENMKSGAGVDIPHAKGCVAARRDDYGTSGMLDNLCDVRVVSAKSMLQVTCLCGPYLDEMVITTG